MKQMLFVISESTCMGFCDRECYLSGHQALLERYEASKAVEKTDMLSGLGYDEHKPEPVGENEGLAVSPKAEAVAAKPVKTRTRKVKKPTTEGT
jgi:hypothetical protein